MLCSLVDVVESVAVSLAFTIAGLLS
jgi:hypothetical protein